MFADVGRRRPTFTQWTRAVARLALLCGLLLVSFLLWIATSTWPWTFAAERLFSALPGEASVGTIDWTGPGDPFDPDTWEVSLEQVRWVPDDPARPRFTLDRVVVGLPDLAGFRETRTLRVPWARVVGLRLVFPTQRPPAPWEPSDDPTRVLIDRVQVWDARVEVAEDAPLPGVLAVGAYADLEAVSFVPGTRELTGRGSAQVARVQYGRLPLTDVVVGSMVADERGVVLDEATYRLTGGKGDVRLGFVGLLKRRADLDLTGNVAGIRIQDIIAATSDQRSPVRGLLSAEAAYQAPGDVPRGSSVLRADVRMPVLRIPLDFDPRELGPVLRGVLELVGYEPGDGIRLDNTHGPLRLGRGWVELDGLRSSVLGVTVDVRSRIDQEGAWILVRRVPRLKVRFSQLTGAVGLVIEGPHEDLRARIATEAELQAGQQLGPWTREGVSISD